MTDTFLRMSASRLTDGPPKIVTDDDVVNESLKKHRGSKVFTPKKAQHAQTLTETFRLPFQIVAMLHFHTKMHTESTHKLSWTDNRQRIQLLPSTAILLAIYQPWASTPVLLLPFLQRMHQAFTHLVPKGGATPSMMTFWWKTAQPTRESRLPLLNTTAHPASRHSKHQLSTPVLLDPSLSPTEENLKLRNEDELELFWYPSYLH